MNVRNVNDDVLVCTVLPPIMVPLNNGDIPDQVPLLDDYSSTIPFNTNFPNLLRHPPSSSGFNAFDFLMQLKNSIVVPQWTTRI